VGGKVRLGAGLGAVALAGHGQARRGRRVEADVALAVHGDLDAGDRDALDAQGELGLTLRAIDPHPKVRLDDVAPAARDHGEVALVGEARAEQLRALAHVHQGRTRRRHPHQRLGARHDHIVGGLDVGSLAVALGGDDQVRPAHGLGRTPRAPAHHEPVAGGHRSAERGAGALDVEGRPHLDVLGPHAAGHRQLARGQRRQRDDRGAPVAFPARRRHGVAERDVDGAAGRHRGHQHAALGREERWRAVDSRIPQDHLGRDHGDPHRALSARGQPGRHGDLGGAAGGGRQLDGHAARGPRRDRASLLTRSSHQLLIALQWDLDLTVVREGDRRRHQDQRAEQREDGGAHGDLVEMGRAAPAGRVPTRRRRRTARDVRRLERIS
jgi:hypothetical protein